MIHSLSSFVASLFLGAAVFFGYSPLLGATLPSATAVFETSLAAPITTSATTLTLTANSVRGGGSLSGYNCFTIDEGSAQAETTCGTVSGTTVTSLSRGISQTTGTTTVSALQFSHRRGANVKITDFPLVQILKAQNNGEETFPNLLTYTSGTACAGTEGNGTICDKSYIDTRVSAGAANANETTKGIIELATAIEQASSTNLGSTAASLVPQAKNGTSSPTAACNGGSTIGALCNVIARNDGKVSPNFIATSSTDIYSFAGSTTFSGRVTVTATTSIAASGTSSAPIVLNGVPYAFPSAQGAVGSILVNDGTGALVAAGAPRYVLSSNTDFGAANSYSTSTALAIPAGFITASSTITVKFKYQCSMVSSSASCTYYLRDGTGVTLASFSVTPIAVPSNHQGFAEMTVGLNNSVASQITYVSGLNTPSNTADGVVSVVGGSNPGTDFTSSVNMANAFSLALVAQGATANVTPTVYSYSMVVNK